MSTPMHALQQALTDLGWNPGPVDGKFGPKTAAAAAGFSSSDVGRFTVPAPAPAPSSPPAVRTEDPRRIALVVGHTATARGAVRASDGVTEFDYNSKLALEVQEYLINAGHEARVFFRQPNLGYGAQIRTVYKETDVWGATATVEFHFNAAAAASATGTETLTSGTAGSKKLAQEIQNRTVAALGLRDRGLLQRNRGDRGGESLFAGKAPAVLMEPYFGSNVGDCQAADRNREALVAAIAEGSLVV